MIRGIIFDCFGVLYGGSLEELKGLCPPDKLQDLRDLNRQADYGFITTDDYVHGIAELLDKSDDEVAEILHAKHIRQSEVVEFAKLMHRRYKTAMLSNVSSGVIGSLFTPDELNDMFDIVVESYEEHMTKPNPAIFELTAGRLGLKPEECVMIDDLMENCDGAEAAGLKSVLFTTLGDVKEKLSKLLEEE